MSYQKGLIMKLFSFCLLLALSFEVNADTFNLPEAGVSFDAPNEFTALSQREIALKFPGQYPPAYAVGNLHRSTSIAYDLKSDPMMPEDLPETMGFFGEFFDKYIPGIEWKERKIINMRGQDWIYMEMSSKALNADIHNIMLVTSRYGKVLMFNFNATNFDFSIMEPELRKSIDSIVLN